MFPLAAGIGRQNFGSQFQQHLSTSTEYYQTTTSLQGPAALNTTIMSPPQYLTGDKSNIDKFIDQFDVGRLTSFTLPTR